MGIHIPSLPSPRFGRETLNPLRILLWLILALTMSIPARAYDSVLVISIDALHPDALDARTSPTLDALMRTGMHTRHGRSVDPPQTLVAHTAMFTGLEPEQSGKRDNDWPPGQPRVGRTTLFDDARHLGYRTLFLYAKPKLGYLVNSAVETHALTPDDGIDNAAAFFRGLGWLQMKARGYKDVRVINGGWGIWDRAFTLPVVQGDQPYDEEFTL